MRARARALPQVGFRQHLVLDEVDLEDFALFRPDDEPAPPSRTPPRQASLEDDEALREAVDRILEKISRSGEASLTPQERDTLTLASRRLKERLR